MSGSAERGQDDNVGTGEAQPRPDFQTVRGGASLVYISVLRSPFSVSRRGFLKAAAAGLALPTGLGASRAPRESLYNGIVLPSPWPPARHDLSSSPLRPPYLADPPAVIPIDVGRQLFVDDFLVEESSLHRVFHRATYHPDNPVLSPAREWELRDPYAALTKTPPSPSAMVFSDGVFFDPAAGLFKMWYMAGYQQCTALALSSDGISWARPGLEAVAGTNIVSLQRRDSNTVWLDLETADASARYKMAGYDLGIKALRLHLSPDGIHWRPSGITGPSSDRSTFFRNPFRDVWVFSLRDEDEGGTNRFRRYVESRDFAGTRWEAGDGVVWTGADRHDHVRPEASGPAELYNLDAVAYESLMLGLFTMYRGERPEREKPNDICLGFSRDGFHWTRPSRDAFIGVSEREGDWNWCNVQSAGGGCVIVGDRLYFYVSGRQGVPGTNMPGACSTGLATLRRDGFASVSDEWPAGVARRAGTSRATLTTRPLRFSGGHMFVNADVAGSIRVEALDAQGRVIGPFSLDRSVPISGNGTRQAVQWTGAPSLADLAGEVVRFRFTLSRARLYAFWVSGSARGESRGYMAAGAPGSSRSTDI